MKFFVRFYRADDPVMVWLVGIVALAIGIAGARPYAGSWNDGSRLAAVESLVDRHTLAIDDSVFCRPPQTLLASVHLPYTSERPDLLAGGTRDKLLIGGHYYSDKPAVISFFMAGVYQVGTWLGLPPAGLRPDVFCWVLTVGTAGLAYVLAALALHALARHLGLAAGIHCAWLASFALCTCALAYTRHVNNHIMLLAVLAFLCLHVARLAKETEAGGASRLRLVLLGTLAGAGYNLDLGAGPLLVATMLGLILYRCRRLSAGLIFLAAATPFVAAGLGINYAIGGVWKPMNMVPEYSVWPGSPFSEDTLTGFARHTPLKLTIYAVALLLGKHGFLVHNLPLLLAISAAAAVLRRVPAHRPELICTAGWCVATWLLYALLSNNYGGACCSIRWFVPFLAPGYYLLALLLREQPRYLPDFLTLSFWGAVLAILMWREGPWAPRMIPFLWPIVGAALASWSICRYRLRQVADEKTSSIPSRLPAAA
jgi:hypothetical protein